MKFKAHPLMVFEWIKPFLWVMVIPIIKAVLQYIRYREIDNIMGLEIGILAVIAFIAFVRYLSFELVYSKDKITIYKGVIFKSKAEISLKKLSSVQTEQNPVDALFGAVTCRINTEAGFRRRSDFTIKLSHSDSERLSELLYGEEKLQRVKFSAVKVALMAITTSSAFTGLVLGVPLVNNAGILLGLGISELLDEINSVSNKIETFFPPIVNTVTLILLVAYGISFVYSFIKYINFRLYLNENILKVCSGFFIRTVTVFKKAAVNDVKIEQSPVLKLFNRFSMKVSVGGFDVSKNASQIIVPSGSKEEIRSRFVSYFPFLEPDGRDITAKRSEAVRNRFLFWPFLFLLLTVVISVSGVILFGEFTRFIFFLTIVALCLVFYYAYTCDYEYRHGKFNFGKNIFAHSVKGFRTCRLYCPRERVGQIKITRLGLDFKQSTCRVKILVCSENADTIRVRHLDFDQAVEEINKNFNTQV